jgi:transposase InsO family protein
MTELCEQFGVSRKTGYKWVNRFEEGGAAGLEDRPRIARHCPHRMSEDVREVTLELRRRHPTWGPKKLLAWLQKRWPDDAWPSASAVGDLLHREGLVRPRKTRRRRPHPGRVVTSATAPNELWTADFKGQFRTLDWDWCYPLTIADLYSRYLLGIQALDGTDGYGVQPVFERVFREVGLPQAIQTDNGPPFVAPRGLLGLTELSVWWIQLGIQPVRIEPGHPEQNGAHERMHRTLKAETASPPSGNRGAQQRRFNRFQRVYNEERPHEALGMKPPGACWKPSLRPFPSKLSEPTYSRSALKRMVSSGGTFAVHHQPIYLSTALSGHWIALEETDNGVWSITFHDVVLGRYDEQERKVFV